MDQDEFQIKVIEGMAELKARMGGLEKQSSQLFKFHNDNQEKINSISDLKERIGAHENGHTKFRIGAGVALFGLLVKAFWDLIGMAMGG